MRVFVGNETIFFWNLSAVLRTHVFSEPGLFSEQTERPHVGVRTECLLELVFSLTQGRGLE